MQLSAVLLLVDGARCFFLASAAKKMKDVKITVRTAAHPLIPSLSELLLKFLQRCQQPVNAWLGALTPVRHTRSSSTENISVRDAPIPIPASDISTDTGDTLLVFVEHVPIPQH